MANLRKHSGPAQHGADNDYQQLATLIDSISEGFVALDHRGKITHCNKAAVALLQADSLQGKQLSSTLDIIDSAGHPVDLQKRILLSDSGFSSRQWRLRYKDGHVINIEISVSPPSPAGFALLLRDISADAALEQEQDELASIASHELRAPIALAENSLNNALEIAKRSDASDPIKHSLAAAYQQLTQLASLINNLALLSSANRSETIQISETFSVAELLEELVDQYLPQAAKKRLSLRAEVKTSAGLLTSSREYVYEILQNFISNAIKYSEKGEIKLRAVALKDGVEFSVVDSGFGASEHEIEKLFTRFYRSEDWRVREHAGAGLGLYVSVKLAEQIDARIEVESGLNQGSTFKLFVPSLEIAS